TSERGHELRSGMVFCQIDSSLTGAQAGLVAFRGSLRAVGGRAERPRNDTRLPAARVPGPEVEIRRASAPESRLGRRERYSQEARRSGSTRWICVLRPGSSCALLTRIPCNERSAV